jgi:hypothetical protein
MTTESSGQLQCGQKSEKGGLKRELGLTTHIAFGVGSIIGSGMFAMPAVMGPGPKIESAIKFVEEGGKKAIITSIENVHHALDGDCGPIITK